MPSHRPAPIAVMDWSSGQLVQARAGQRREYRPLADAFPALRSRTPLDLARELRSLLPEPRIYVADLDALQGRPDSGATTLVAELLAEGWSVWLDQGAQSDLEWTAANGRPQPVWGTESFAGPAAMLEFLAAAPEVARGVVSLDLQSRSGRELWFGHASDGLARPHSDPERNLATAPNWADVCPVDLVAAAVACGASQFLVLNLSDVGAQGNTTAPLLSALRAAFPTLTLATGGGIRDTSMLRPLTALGLDYVLVGTWLWEQLADRSSTTRGYSQ